MVYSNNDIKIIEELPNGVYKHIVFYDEDKTSIKSVTIYKDDVAHSPDNDTPAIYNLTEEGVMYYEAYYKDGAWHRDEDLPARIWYSYTGKIQMVTYYQHDTRIEDFVVESRLAIKKRKEIMNLL